MGWGSREEWKLGEWRAWGMGECVCGGQTHICSTSGAV